ncbi:N-acyl homoserine lactonase family protein [Paraburkholderia elongata]|uniref:MBL fold metallo-hydrolase n=1 Tax=Paraburkholderia elongata TaxID=2675747 RepID=A0A972NT03_9BURK|nr:N-acyl homoserine lactonase family protein [Paraburkholderia elongata]NPT57302.1 MBL fold metallo-hydrolase [Paraburkholderia elongata]
MTFTIVPIRCGDIVNHERSCFLYRKNCGSARLHAPCIAWLLRSARHTIVVDAGPGSRSRAPQCYTETDAGIDDLLQYGLTREGVDPASVELVILTHLHNDHVGGARLFTNARFHVQEAELKEAVWPVPFQRPIYETNQRGHTPPWVDILDRMDVAFGDADVVPGIRVLRLPGHTAGSQGVLVDTQAGPYLIAGDLIPLYENWPEDGSEPIPNGNHTDLRAYDESFRRIAALGAKVLPAHEPRVFERKVYPPPSSR